jgi:asparagine synthase (glutamine-hydrolysing)
LQQLLALRKLPRHERDLIRRVRSEHLTYLSTGRLVKLAQLSGRVQAEGVTGPFVECGCALGGSAIVLAACKRHDRILHVYDVFGMIPPPTAADGEDVHARYDEISSGHSAGLGGGLYYGYLDNLYDVVKANFARLGYPIETSNVVLVPGLLQDTLAPDRQVALAHVDVDWYEPVRVAIERLWPRLPAGGAVVFDDYYTYSGCRKAVDALLADVGSQVTLDGSWGSLAVTRRR